MKIKRKLAGLLASLCVCTLLVSCGGSEEITLNLSYGDRTGKYSGDMVDGVPDGYGKFTTQNSEGDTWTYEGEFKNGHFEGEGTTTWKDGQVEIGTYSNDVIVPLSGDDLKTLQTNTEEFKNHYVEFVGRVFTTPEYDEDGVYLQVWRDIKNSDLNTVVYISDTSFDVSMDDYIKIVGLVADTFTGQNALGGEITCPIIKAKEYEITSYTDAMSPTISEIEVDQTQTQYGYSVTVEKVEFAEEETRVYVKVENAGSSTFTLYSFNTKITQNGAQYSEQDNWEADYPSLESELLSGVSTSGVIAFPAIDSDSDFKIIFDGYSYNYEENIEQFIFDITC